jgi:hypothetical protein
MVRLGLCCIFRDEPIKFNHTTVRIIKGLEKREEQLRKLSGIALKNSQALLQSVETCKRLGIGAFRVLSQILPIYSHPEYGYKLDDLPDAIEIRDNFRKVRDFAADNNIRLSFHPDQFNILASPREEVFTNTIRELSYQCLVAELIGADNVNIHMGGVYGDKQATLKRFAGNFKNVPELVKRYLTLENDDISYNVEDLYPVCMETGSMMYTIIVVFRTGLLFPRLPRSRLRLGNKRAGNRISISHRRKTVGIRIIRDCIQIILILMIFRGNGWKICRISPWISRPRQRSWPSSGLPVNYKRYCNI